MYRKHLLFFILLPFTVFSQAQDNPLQKQEQDSLMFIRQKARDYLHACQQYHRNGQYELYKKYADSLLEFSRSYELREAELQALMNQAIYYNNINTYEKALRIYHEALDKCGDIPNRDIARTVILVNVGNVYNNIGAYDKAIAVMDTVIQRTRMYKTPPLTAIAAYNGLSTGYSKLGDEKESLRYLEKVRKMGLEIGDTTVVVTALNNMSSSYMTLGDYGKSLDLSNNSLNLQQNIVYSKQKTTALLNIGMSYLRSGKPKQAITYLNQAGEASVQLHIVEVEMKTHNYLAEAYEATGDFESSYKEQKRYSDMVKSNMKEKGDAMTLDLKKENSDQQKIIQHGKRELAFLRAQKGKIILGCFLGFLLLSGILFFYYRKRKSLESENARLIRDFRDIHNRHDALKTQMEEIAGRIGHENAANDNNSPSYKNSSLSAADRQLLMHKLTDYMEQEKPYLDFDLNHSQLASRLGMSSNHLSEVLSLCFKQNFYNFINIYRVDEACRLMKAPEYRNLKIIAIAYESGFKSKSSFNRIFKNHTGYTPTAYKEKFCS
ncbi:AraC family transcriptional regulator [Sinomicrobium oceani]|uniref:AraC family transcriptional regulator n=1 Tax=Sinomicrobium oceani TaxID=1150368 RepID=UPI00227CC12B|nr:AraC family transcriptional regulator [Sinomicrobium oceani]